MLIGLCGGRSNLSSGRHPTNSVIGICAGKHSVATYLTEHYQFSSIHLARTAVIPFVEKSASQARVPQYPSANGGVGNEERYFGTVDELLEFVTKRWQQRWVTTDVWDETILENLLRRPFFLFVSVDAPVSLRWQRFKER